MQTNHITVTTTDGCYQFHAAVQFEQGSTRYYRDSIAEDIPDRVVSIYTYIEDDVQDFMLRHFDEADLCNDTTFTVNDFPSELKTEPYTIAE
jgi:hypothetical protein